MERPSRNLIAFLKWFSDHDSGAVSVIAEHMSDDVASPALVVESYGDLFCALGILNKKAHELELIHPENSRYLVKSLLAFAEANTPVLGDFSRHAFRQTWVAVLYQLEYRRLLLDPPHRSHTRRIFVAEAVIVGRAGSKRFVLFDHDTQNWNVFKFVGGKAEPREKATATVHRELREELQDDFDRVLSLRSSALDEHPPELLLPSKTRGALTRYTVVLYGVDKYSGRHLSYSGEKQATLKWIELDDLKLGLQRTPDQFFTSTLTDGVLNYIAETSVLYEMSAADLARRAEPIQTWRLG